MDYEQAFHNFQIQMGDVVQHKTMPGVRLSVLSQVLERWPGGFARLYVCRGISGDETVIDKFYEHELQPYKIP